ncbi:MAG: riboflavin synthase [Phycisphaerales bacterium]|nr:riboflavin synthase [Phycisphaerales bacterium]
MFTGIIQDTTVITNIVKNKQSMYLEVAKPKTLSKVQLGDSIALDGVCLTVVKNQNNKLGFDISEETLRCTTLGSLEKKTILNIETALRADSQLGGHFVLGHVDGVGKIVSLKPSAKEKGFIDYVVELPKNLSKYCFKKGSIAIDGISLTIATIKKNKISIAIIPHTYKITKLHQCKPNHQVNIECDMLVKYVHKITKR